MDVLKSRPGAVTAGLASLSAVIFVLRALQNANNPSCNISATANIIPSPRSTLLPHLSTHALALLPYPPNALPGSRDVVTPHGAIKVFEFGPASASERVLLLPGISTPCISLSNLATALVTRGCRVMLFDYYGRGWSDTPDPAVHDHDEQLYITQILYVLASSEISWMGAGKGEGFHVMGYSFGGGLAASFASYLPHVVRSVTFIAPGGLMPWSGNSWRTRLLYFTSGLFPEYLAQHFVRKRFEPVNAARYHSDQDEAAVLVEQAEAGSDPWDDAVVATKDASNGAGAQINVTVGDVMAWQLRHHRGFIPAVMSAFRYGPIHERYEEWGRLAAFLGARRGHKEGSPIADALPGLSGGKVLLVLGGSDPIVKPEWLVPEMKRVLGEGAVEAVVLDAGHEVAITKGAEIASAALNFWNNNKSTLLT